MVKTPPNPSERVRDEVMRGTLQIEKDRQITRVGEQIEELEDLKGVGVDTAQKLRENGYYSISDVAAASSFQLKQIDGIGEAKAEDIAGAALQAEAGGEMELTDLDGVGETTALKLRNAGIREPYELRGKSQNELAAIDGIGPKKAARIRADVEFEAPAGATETGFEPETESGTTIFREARGTTLEEFDETVKTTGSGGVRPTANNIFARGPDRQEAISEHADRTEESRRADESFNAPVMLDEDKWARNKNQYDYPGVDTIPRSRKLERVREETAKAKEQGFLFGLETDMQATENDRARGEFQHLGNKIGIDPSFRQSEDTLAHEVGHAVDAGVGDVSSKTAGIFADEQVFEEAKEVSRQQRGQELDSDYLSSTSEIFADFYAEATLNPRRAKKEAPEAFRALNEEVGMDMGFF